MSLQCVPEPNVHVFDARNVYTVVSARSHVFTDEQLANLTAITWLYRGENEKFVELLGRYQAEAGEWLAAMASATSPSPAGVKTSSLKSGMAGRSCIVMAATFYLYCAEPITCSTVHRPPSLDA